MRDACLCPGSLQAEEAPLSKHVNLGGSLYEEMLQLEVAAAIVK